MKKSIDPDFLDYIINLINNKYKNECDDFKKGYAAANVDIIAFMKKYNLVLIFDDRDNYDV